MAETCTIEVGLLKKKPCGQNAVTKCANCEQPLCAKHATSMMSGGKKTMLCGECAKAWKEQAKTLGEVPPTPAAAAAKPGAGAAPPKPAAAAPKPAAVAPKPAAPKPAAAAPAAKKEAPKEEEKHDDDAPLEFTPSKKPEDKK